MAKHSKKKPVKVPDQAPLTAHFAATETWNKLDWRNAAIVLAVAVAIRLVFFFLNRHNNPLFYYPIMDGKYHLEWAQEILSGNFWGNGVFFRAPLYPYFLAFLYKIGGTHIGFVIFCQHLIGAASAGLVYLVARLFFRPGIALLAGLFAALYWPFLYFEADLLIVTLIVFFDLLSLYFLILALKTSRAGYFIAAGLILGLSAVARPNILVLIPALPFVFWLWPDGRNKDTATRRKVCFRQTVFVCAAAALMILPVLVRNWVVGRDIVPIASQGGVNFYIGNNPDADGRTAIVPGTRWDWWGGYEDAIRMAEKEAGRKLKPSEVSNHYFRKGAGFVFTQPDRSIPLLGKKLHLFWAAGERSNNKYIYFFWHQGGMGKVPLPGFWLIAPLGLLGGVLLWPRRRELSLFYLFTVTYMAGVIAFFVNARFRLPIVPILIMFAAYACFHLWHVARHRRSELWKPLVVFALCVFAIDFDLVGFGENKINEDALSHYTLGNAYLNRGDTKNAIAEYEEALDRYKQYGRKGFLVVARNVEYNLGRLYWSDKRCEEAIPHLERVGGNDQFAVVALEMLADCYESEKRYNNAIDAYELILRAVPNNDKARFGLARTHRLMGNLEEAETLFRSIVSDGTGQNAEAYMELAATLEALEKWDEAAAAYENAARSPAYRVRALIGAARMYARGGRRGKGLRLSRPRKEFRPRRSCR